MPATTTFALHAEGYAERLSEIGAHAASCGRLDCGHLYRSDSRAIRRATLLYLLESNGGDVDLDAEAPEVAAVLGILRETEHATPIYQRGTLASGGRGYVRATMAQAFPLPNVEGIRLTPERIEVFSLAWQGHSATEIAGITSRSRETVKSHMGNLRRHTGAHDAPSALVALVLAGLLS